MQAAKALGGLLLLLLALVAVAGGAWLVVAWFLGLSTDQRTAVASITSVASVPIITLFTTRALDRRRSRDEAIREHRTKLYDDLIQGLLKMLSVGSPGKPFDAEAMNEFLIEVTPPLIIYGSREVIQRWVEFRSIGGNVDLNNLRPMFVAFENILRAMRKDLGHHVITQPQFELLRVFINDIDSLK